jgi:hypothetical protein
MGLISDVAALAAPLSDFRSLPPSLAEEAATVLQDIQRIGEQLRYSAASLSARCHRNGLDAMLGALGPEARQAVTAFLGRLPALWAELLGDALPDFPAQADPPSTSPPGPTGQTNQQAGG